MKIRAQIARIDPVTLANGYDDHAAGCWTANDAASRLVENLIEGGGVTKKTLLEAAGEESVRHVMRAEKPTLRTASPTRYERGLAPFGTRPLCLRFPGST